MNSPTSAAMVTTSDHVMISNFDQIEEARFQVANFKKHLLDLMDYCQELTFQIQEKGLSQEFSPPFHSEEFNQRETQVRTGFSNIENVVEGFANGLSKQLNETHTQNIQIERDRDELSKSLQQIEVCYQKNKKKLERDLNKMEYKVKQVQDTREKMQLRHIKGLDIVTNEVNRIMPNSLTEKQLHNNLYLDEEDEEQKTNEQIKRDLEDVDDVFAANVWSAMKLGPDNVPVADGEGEPLQEEDKPVPEEEWIESSSDEDKTAGAIPNTQFDLS